MKLWVLTILSVQIKLEGLVERVEKQIDDLALNLGGKTMELYNGIMKWNDVLRRLVNLRVLGDRMRELLTDEEYRCIIDFLHGSTMEEIALVEKKGHSTILRRIQSGVYKGMRMISGLGFNEERLMEDYGEIMLIRKTMKRIARTINASQRVAQMSVSHLVSAEVSPVFSSSFF